MKKKVLSMFLGISMIVSLAAGCSGGNASEDTQADAENTETAAEESSDGGSITLMAPDWAIPTEEQLAEFKDAAAKDAPVRKKSREMPEL